MKTWHLIIGIVGILAIVCSPALAISKSDVISYYTGESSPAIPIAISTALPTPAPTQNSQVPFEFSSFSSKLPWNNNSISQPFVNWKMEILDDNIAEFVAQKTSYLSGRTLPSGNNNIAEYVAKKGNRFIWESTDPSVVIFNDIGVGKPNIYLYSDRDLTAQVRLAPEEDITVSEPVYQPGIGWLADIRDGSLNGNGDFLFYEGSVPDTGWQKQEGSIIRAAYREQDMASMLGQYGFNEKETVEFVEYWSQHLAEGMDCVFYPQETEAVERVMPLYISPEPDHVMRIWFYAEPLVSPPDLVTSTEKIVREGFYVVEWGVIIDDQYWINHSPASSEVML